MSCKGFLGRHSRLLKEDQEFYDLKNKAAEFYRSNGVPQRIEDVLNEMFLEKPDDIYGYLGNYFSRFSTVPVISKVTAMEVYDKRGLKAVRTEVHCIIRNQEQIVCRATMSVPCVALAEGLDENANKDHQLSVTTALEWITNHFSLMLQGFNPTDQSKTDKILSDFLTPRYLERQESLKEKQEELRTVTPIEPNQETASTKDKKSKKGAQPEKPLPPADPPEPLLPGSIAVGVVSLAVAKAAAKINQTPLYRHIRSVQQTPLRDNKIPLPMITILSSGRTSTGKLNLLEEVILMPNSSQRAKQELAIPMLISLALQVISLSLELQSEMRTVASKPPSKVSVKLLEAGILQVGFDRPEQALDLVKEACSNLSLPLGQDLNLAINCSAHSLIDYARGKYDVIAGCQKSPDELVDFYVDLIGKYPAIKALIDPFRKEDAEQWEKLASALGESCGLIADAAYGVSHHVNTVPSRVPKGTTGVVLRHRGSMTISDLNQRIAEQTETIMAADREESSGTAIVDMAVGLGLRLIKMGGLRGEQMNKYNRLIAIEEELEQEETQGAGSQSLAETAEDANTIDEFIE